MKEEQKAIVKLAVRKYAESLKTRGAVVGDQQLLIDATASLPLTHLDQWERLIRSEYEYAMGFHRSYSNRNRFVSQPKAMLSWIDLCCGDGYQREKTLLAIRGPAPNAFFLAFVLRRLNDWVGAVRVAARDALPIVARITDASVVAQVVCAVLPFWDSWGRMNERDRSALMSIIEQRPILEALSHLIEISVSGPMPTIVTQLNRSERLDEYLPNLASRAVQPAVRARAYRCLLEGHVTWLEGREWVWTDKRYCEGRLQPVVGSRLLKLKVDKLAMAELAVRDRSPMVRRVGAESLIKVWPQLNQTGMSLIKRISEDPIKSVADMGQFVLNKLANAKTK